MPRNGSGLFVRRNSRVTGPNIWQDDLDADVRIRADLHDVHDQDVADGISQSISRDGQTQPTNHLPMNGWKHTSVGAATARNEYLTLGQYQDGAPRHGSDNGSAGDYVVSLSPQVPALVAGLMVSFVAQNTTGGASTLTVSGRPTKNLRRHDGTATVSGDIRSGDLIVAFYVPGEDRFRAINVTRQFGTDEGQVPTGEQVLHSGTTLNVQTGSTSARYRFVVDNAADDEGIWQFVAFSDGSFRLDAMDDDGGSQQIIFEVNRNAGGAVDHLHVPTDLRVGVGQAGNTVVQQNHIQVYESEDPSTLQDLIDEETIEEEHGLGGTPQLFEVYVVCQSPEAGYAVGDALKDFTGGHPYADDTHIGVAINGNTTGFGLIHKTNNTIVGITEANWDLVFKAVRIDYS